MVFDPTPSLLVDIGTNGEIVLQSGGKLTACATAAGPAFEGCGLRCGTRAREGAVSDLRLDAESVSARNRNHRRRAARARERPLRLGVCGFSRHGAEQRPARRDRAI